MSKTQPLIAINIILLLIILFNLIRLGRESKNTEPGMTAAHAALTDFLQSAREANFHELPKDGRLKTKRDALTKIVNRLPGKHRDELREEIKDANWYLEAHEILATPEPISFEDRAGQLLSLNALTESPSENIHQSIQDKLIARQKLITSFFRGELQKFVQSFKENPTTLQAEIINLPQLAMMADALTDQMEESKLSLAEQNLPDWILASQDWIKRADERLSAISVKGSRADLANTNQLLQEGDALELQIIGLDLPAPEGLITRITNLRSRLAEAERTTLNEYQIWALGEIRLVKSMAGGKASEKIEKILKGGKDKDSSATQAYKLLLDKSPIFRAKLLELSGVPIPSAADVTPEFAPLISNKLNRTTHWNGLKHLAQCLNRDLLEQRLLKVDEALLRRPLDRLYAEAFDDCWQYLEDTEHRIKVAEAAVKTEKRPLAQPR